MKKKLIILAVIVVFFILCVVPFWPVGGHYYRGLLLVWDIRPRASSGGFLPPLTFEPEISLLRWVDPTSFKFVHGGENYCYAKDRFGVYGNRFRLDEFDPKSFRAVQAPITGEWFYIDDRNVRVYDALVLNAVSGDLYGDPMRIQTGRFDIATFEPLGGGMFKDKNGVYKFFRGSSAVDKTTPEHGRVIELFHAETLLDPKTFRVDSCEEKECRASDVNGTYLFRRLPLVSRFDIRRLEP